MNILIVAPFDEGYIDKLRNAHNVTYLPDNGESGILSDAEINQKLKNLNADVFVCETEKVTACTVDGAENLKMVCVCRSGLNNIDISALKAKGILVTNTPGRNAAAVAEVLVALMISLSRHLFEGERLIRSGNWLDSLKTYFNLMGYELSGRSIGFLGFGCVAREAAKRLASFDMEMYAYDPYVKQEVFDEFGVTKAEINDIFANCDYVSNHLPVTAETKGMIDANKFYLMKKSAYFINTARADTTDEDALIKILRDKKIEGAALDVFNEEPIPIDHPILTLDNVILIPHLGGASKDVVRNHSQMVYKDICDFATGMVPKRRVK